MPFVGAKRAVASQAKPERNASATQARNVREDALKKLSKGKITNMLFDEHIFPEKRRGELWEGDGNLALTRPWQWQPHLPTPVYFSLPCRLKKQWERRGKPTGKKWEKPG
jgi:hypothetical protein